MPRSAHRFAVRQQTGPADVFAAAAACVLTFGMQRGAGLTVSTDSPRAVEGLELTLRGGSARCG